MCLFALECALSKEFLPLSLINTNIYFFVEDVLDWNHLEERVGSGSVGDLRCHISFRLG